MGAVIVALSLGRAESWSIACTLCYPLVQGEEIGYESDDRRAGRGPTRQHDAVVRGGDGRCREVLVNAALV